MDSINYTTKGFVKLHRNNSSSVFESLITCGDLMTSHEMDDNAFPLPPTLLVTRAFAETCVAHLRGSHPDIDAFVDALDVYNTEMLQTSQRWLDVAPLVNCRAGLEKAAEWVTVERVKEVLAKWHTPEELLRQLAEYVMNVVKAMGPSFLELVAEDISRGEYSPPEEDGLLLPEDAHEALENLRRRKELAEEAARRVGVPRTRASVEGATNVDNGGTSADAVHPTAVRRRMSAAEKRAGKAPVDATEGTPGRDEMSPAVGAALDKLHAARKTFASANARVTDPLGSALKKSTMARRTNAPAPGEDPWAKMGKRALAMESETQDPGGTDEKEDDEEPAAATPRKMKVKITVQPEAGALAVARTVGWGEASPGGAEIGTSEITTPGSDAGGRGLDTGEDGRKKRKKYTLWTTEQERELVRLVEQIGVGNWERIRTVGQSVFGPEKTGTQLKDKWRNILKAMKRNDA